MVDEQGDAPVSGERTFTTEGLTITVLAGTEDTGGAWSFFEFETAAGFDGPPLHWHERMVEGFYVLDGTLRFTIDDRDFRAGPKEFVLMPAGSLHTFAVTEDGPGRFLLQVSPGGYEEYLEQFLDMVAEAEQWPPDDMGPVVELMNEYDTYTPPAE